jgi:hypothetical protein
MVIDYSCKTPLRQFELIIEGRSLFVNQYFLAEISPYFYALCFSETFEESRQGRATLDDITYEDILELLNSICPDEDFGLGPRIDGTFMIGRLMFRNLFMFVRISPEIQSQSCCR